MCFTVRFMTSLLPSVLLSQLGGAAASFKCVFLHGVGWPNTSAPTTSDTDEYWGGDDNINSLTPWCSSRVFLHQETRKRGWDDDELGQGVCHDILGADSDDKVIRNTVIVTHSLGNLIFAAALRRGDCSMDASSHFVAITAPWHGTKGVSVLAELCSNTTTHTDLKWLVQKMHYCDEEEPGLLQKGYRTMAPDYPGFMGLWKTAQVSVSAAMCGQSAFGLSTLYSVAMETLSTYIEYGEDNDGMVPVSSCFLPGMVYKPDYTSRFYAADVNHVDGTLRDGNGVFGTVTRQPNLWFSSLFTSNSTEMLVV